MKQPYTLFLPSWYPVDENSIDGIFIRKHAQVVAGFMRVVVVAAFAGNEEQLLVTTPLPNLVEYRVFYRKSTWRPANQWKLLHALYKGYRAALHQQGSPACLHLHVFFPAGIFAFFLLLFRHIPLFITEHWTGYNDADGRYQKLNSLIRFISRRLFARASAIGVVSRHLQQDIQQKIPSVSSDKFLLTNNVLEVPALPVSSYLPYDFTNAMYVGSLNNHHKNISLLINAVAIVKNKYPAFRLHVYGDGEGRSMFEKEAFDKGVAEQIIFHGRVNNSQLADKYAQHSLFLMPSRFETFSIATAEALMNGLVVVSTRCGGPEEFVHEGNGVLVEQDNPAAFAKAIEYVIQHAEAYNRLAISSEMRERFSKEKVAEQLKKMYTFTAQQKL